MSDPLRLAVFGGSFNPPHLAHRMLIAAALETDTVDAVWVIPTYQHPFGKELAPYEDRVQMCRLLVAPFGDRVVVSLLERELGGESRTLPLLERIRDLLPGATLRLLIGADILAEAHKWYRWDDVAALAPPLVFGRTGRPGVESAETTSVSEEAIQFTMPDISSTEIRRRVEAGQDASALLPASVLRYIALRGLFRGDA